MTEERRVESERLKASIRTIRGERIILDSNLAALYGVETKRLNERVKRNKERFGEKYVFQLTKKEFDALRSQSATSKTGRGGRRYTPWVFTEHGVVMAATVLDSDRAVAASKFIVDVFVELKRRHDMSTDGMLVPVGAVETSSAFWQGGGQRLQEALNHVLDTVVDTRRGTTAREEAQTLISESIQHLKERLKNQGLQNEEILARVTKLLAEAEKEKALAAKNRAQADALEFATIVRKLRLLLEVQKAMTEERLDGFMDVLKQLGETGHQERG